MPKLIWELRTSEYSSAISILCVIHVMLKLMELEWSFIIRLQLKKARLHVILVMNMYISLDALMCKAKLAWRNLGGDVCKQVSC